MMEFNEHKIVMIHNDQIGRLFPIKFYVGQLILMKDLLFFEVGQ